MLTRWLGDHTYAVVFLTAVVDATGIPFPGRIVLTAAGAFAATGDVSLTLLIALGAAGVLVSDHLWYFAGGLGGDRLLRVYCRLTFTGRECVQQTTSWFERFGPLTIPIGRFVAIVRIVAWPLARDHGLGYPAFLALDVPAALVWSSTWVGLGWFLGGRWAEATDETRWLGGAMALVAAVVFTSVVLWRRRRRRLATG
jgi:membrane protein DedA with SNARE-associated domain